MIHIDWGSKGELIVTCHGNKHIFANCEEFCTWMRATFSKHELKV